MGRKSTTSSKMRRNNSCSTTNYKQSQPQKSNLPQTKPVNNNPGLLNNVTQGAAMGAGMSLGHSIFNSISSDSIPNDGENTNMPQNKEPQNPTINIEMDLNPIENRNCYHEMADFQKCLNKNQGQINFCKEYFNMLDICRGNNYF